ncbi:MAG TPA: EAL domain-containing protein [Clostridiales bacterium]|nr:EAL domain-containing protein [Clostridiales bacterium]
MYIARQAIFNSSLKVYGYELLFRGEIQSAGYDGVSSVQASASVLGGLFESGINQIVDNKVAFINFDNELLQSDVVELIDPQRLIVEVLENVPVDGNLIQRIISLREKGYKIALDDLEESSSTYQLIPYADIIKYDIIITPLDQIEADVKRMLIQRKILLAEKIETEEEFKKAKDMGFHLFQGFFFSKPCLITESSSHTTVKSQYTRIIAELRKEEPSFEVLAEIIEKDATLAYRLVRLSSTRSGKERIYSIRHALTYMGLKEIERWINVLMLRDLNNSKPDELMRVSLIRAKFAELTALHSKLRVLKYEAFIMGLFSTIDAMINRSMEEALKNVALPEVITEALVKGKGALYPVYRLVIAYEKGDWAETEKLTGMLKLKENLVSNDYLQAIKWAKEMMDTF